MTISAIGSNVTSSLQNVGAMQSVGTSSATSEIAGASATEDKSNVSGPGLLMANLKDLQKNDPEKFKAVMSKLSEAVKAKASASTDPKEQKMLNDFASKLDAAGKSGDLSALTPSKGAHGHGHMHGAHGPKGPPPGPPPSDDKDASSTRDTSTASSSSAASTYAKAAEDGASGKAKMDTLMSELSSIVDAA